MPHRPIEGRAATDYVEAAILDFVGAYTWQETLLLFVLLHETNSFALGHSKSNVCQLGLLKGINILVVTWSRLAFVLHDRRCPIGPWSFRILWLDHACSPFLGVNAGL